MNICQKYPEYTHLEKLWSSTLPMFELMKKSPYQLPINTYQYNMNISLYATTVYEKLCKKNLLLLQGFRFSMKNEWTIATGHQISKEVDDEERQALPGTVFHWSWGKTCSHRIHHVPLWYQWYPQLQVKAPALKLVSRHVLSISSMNCWWRVRWRLSTHRCFPNRPTRDATERTTVDRPEMSMLRTETQVWEMQYDAILINTYKEKEPVIIIMIIILTKQKVLWWC